MAQLEIDEGKRLVVYADSLKLPTVGVGHLVTGGAFKIGDVITQEQCDEFFHADFDSAVSGCYKLFGESRFDGLPDAVQGVLVNMCFNLGCSRLAGFKKFVFAICQHNWQAAADEMKASRWYSQVGDRAKRLETIIRGQQ